MSSRRQRSVPLGGRYRQVSLYTISPYHSFTGGLSITPVNLGHAWMITPHFWYAFNYLSEWKPFNIFQMNCNDKSITSLDSRTLFLGEFAPKYYFKITVHRHGYCSYCHCPVCGPWLWMETNTSVNIIIEYIIPFVTYWLGNAGYITKCWSMT